MAVATSTFTGFDPDAVDFLAELAMNNDRDWFNPRKADYERLLKAPMEALVAALAERLADRDIPLQADPKRSIFRIYRDTRFAKDKSPYKTNLGASFPWLRRGPDGQPAVAEGHGPRQRRVLQLPAGRDVRRWRDVDAREAPPRRLPTGRGRRARTESARRSRSPVSSRHSGRSVRHEHLKRVPPGFPPDHPHGRPAALQGRRVRAAPVRRRGPVAVALPDTLADAYAAGMPVFRFLDTIRA